MISALRNRFQDVSPARFVRAAMVVAPLGLVALAAYLQARGVGEIVGAGLASPRGLLAAAGPATAHAAEPPPAKSVGSYALFGGAPVASVAPVASAVASAPGDLYAAPVCADVSLAALATFADPRASLATLRVTAPAATSVTVGQGEAVLDGRVLFIGADRVWIERPVAAGGVCQAALFAVPPLAASTTHAPTPAASAAPTGLAARVRSIGEHEVEIDRGAVDEILERAPILARAVRLAPVVGADGAVRGYAVRGISPGADGALATALGLKVGDTLLSVNGFGVAKPEELLAAYGRLRGAPRIALDVERQGARVTLVALTR